MPFSRTPPRRVAPSTPLRVLASRLHRKQQRLMNRIAVKTDQDHPRVGVAQELQPDVVEPSPGAQVVLDHP